MAKPKLATGLYRYHTQYDGNVLVYVANTGHKYITGALLTHIPVRKIRIKKEERGYLTPLNAPLDSVHRTLERLGATKGALDLFK